MKQLHISPDLALPLEAVTETFGILAIKRVGKSNAGVVMAEEMYDAGLPWVAIDPKGDWWGVRASAEGKGPGLPVVVFGGEHGDVPLEETSGRLIADLVVDQRLTCVLDISGLMDTNKSAARRFLTDFAERLYARNREPLHVFCEEADEYIPQLVRGDAAKMVGAFERLVKRGGFRGIGVTLITQRSASLNKDVLTQIGTLIVLQTTSPQDRKAILGWVVQHALGQELVDGLPELAKGEAWVFSPAWLHILKKITFRRRRTFDSGATPTMGVKTRPPATLADVDLVGIRTLMASTIEKAKADDPRELRKRIQELERETKLLLIQQQQAGKKQVEVREVEKVVRVEVPVYPDKVKDWLRDTAVNVDAAAKQLVDLAKMLRAGADIKVTGADRLRREVSAEELVSPALSRRIAQPERGNAGEGLTPPSRPAAASARSIPTAVAPNGHQLVTSDLKLGRGERKVLAVLAQWPDGRAQKDVAFLAGYSAKASTLGVILSNLRRGGLVEPGQPVKATNEGLAAAGGVQDLPRGRELLNHWMRHPRIGEGERKVLRALIDAYPEALTHAELCERTGYSPDASTMGVILSKLRKLGLVEGGARRVPDSFMEAIVG
jgi:hypothetical protein